MRLTWIRIPFQAYSATFKVKNYRVSGAGQRTFMKLETNEFIRRFPINVLPKGQHLFRHSGFYRNGKPASFWTTYWSRGFRPAPRKKCLRQDWRMDQRIYRRPYRRIDETRDLILWSRACDNSRSGAPRAPVGRRSRE